MSVNVCRPICQPIYQTRGTQITQDPFSFHHNSLINTGLLRSIDGKKEENDGHLARIKMEEDSEDRSPAALDVAEQYSNTDVGKAAMESHKVVIIIITLKDMS